MVSITLHCPTFRRHMLNAEAKQPKPGTVPALFRRRLLESHPTSALMRPICKGARTQHQAFREVDQVSGLDYTYYTMRCLEG